MSVYAVADLHGNLILADKILNFLKPEDTLYFLGDAADRGSDGLAIMEKFLSAPNVVYLKGNHEEFFEFCVPLMLKHLRGDFVEQNFFSFFYQWIDLNGGLPTWTATTERTEKEIAEILDKIRKLPLTATYHSPAGNVVILEHAGFTPGIYRKTHDSLWDRDHFQDEWPEGLVPDNLYVVHGHTPVQYLKYYYDYDGRAPYTKEELFYKRDWNKGHSIDEKPTIIRYCSGHKFDIDMCTISSNRVALLNLDTFEEIYFDE